MSARRFTLVEALMAILMLAIVTGIIVRLVGRVHQVWRSRRNLTEVYEEARVLFGVVSDDLRCAEATADGPPERQVRFHIEEDGELRFVTVGEPSPGASSRLIEVSYRVEDNQFKRAFRDTTSTDWWPYGERTAIASPTAEHILAERVIGYEVVCYHDDGTEWSTPSVPSEETGMPHAVRFNVTLLDRSSFNLWRQLTGARQTEYALANARTVTKRLFLGGGQ